MAYRHQALPSKGSIRLVQLLDGIACTVTMVDLDKAPHYFALSYTWGSPSYKATKQGVSADRCCTILCNGKTFLVTRNLYDFLIRMRQLRHFTSDDYIWIDAICINQTDLDEKNAQVHMMADIYRSARSVIVWLGEEDDETGMALELLSRVGAVRPECLDRLEFVRESEKQKLLGHIGTSPQHWKALLTFMDRNWFNRVWIIQEIVFARKIIVFCGGISVSWDDLVNVSRYFGVFFNGRMTLLRLEFGEPGFLDEIRTVIAHAFQLSDLRNKLRKSVQRPAQLPRPRHQRKWMPKRELLRSRRSNRPGKWAQKRRLHQSRQNYESRENGKESEHLHLLEILCMGGEFEATDPRDKIFALLGIATTLIPPSSVTPIPRPDYKRPIEQIYIETSKFIIEQCKDLALLSARDDRGCDDKNIHKVSNLPSWVPDYSVSGLSYDQNKRCAKAAGNLTAQIRWLTDPRLLGIAGAKLGEVADKESLVVNPFNRVFRRWVRILRHLEPIYRTGQTRLDVFARTLIEDAPIEQNALGPEVPFQLWILCEAADALKEYRRTGSTNTDTRETLYVVQELGMTEPSLPPGSCFNIEYIIGLASSETDAPKDREWMKDFYSISMLYYDTFMCTGAGSVFVTDGGLLGTGRHSLQVGDTVWIIPGVGAPIILRSTGTENRFRLVGRAYLHGFMDGEALEQGPLDIQEIILE